MCPSQQTRCPLGRVLAVIEPAALGRTSVQPASLRQVVGLVVEVQGWTRTLMACMMQGRPITGAAKAIQRTAVIGRPHVGVGASPLPSPSLLITSWFKPRARVLLLWTGAPHGRLTVTIKVPLLPQRRSLGHATSTSTFPRPSIVQAATVRLPPRFQTCGPFAGAPPQLTFLVILLGLISGRLVKLGSRSTGAGTACVSRPVHWDW